MTRYGILAVAVLTFGFAAGAQNSPSNNPAGASAQAQTSTSAAVTAGSSQQNQNSTAQKDNSKQASASASSSSNASASANAAGSSLNLAGGTDMQAMLVTPLDAKRNKPGDPVVAKTTQDVKQGKHVVLKKGSELKGHVTQAEARSSQNAQSALGVVFDSAVPKNGQPMPVNLTIQALAAAQNQTMASVADDQAAAGSASQAGFTGGAAAPVASGGGLVRGVGSTVGGVANTAGNVAGNVGQTASGTVGAATHTVASAGSTGGLSATGQLMSNSTGVFNLEGLNLTSDVSNGTQATSVVNSTTQNVHLASGTQMVLQVVKQ